MWQYFSYIAFSVIALWLASSVMIYSKNKTLQRTGVALHISATIVIGIFIAMLWVQLERPPLRTMAETRIWYSFFLSAIGIALYFLYKQKWMLNYSAAMSIVFILVTYFKPDTINKTLMPALQSVWFVPHVIVYMFAYAMLGMATIAALYGIFLHRKNKDTTNTLFLTDQLINIGFAFLTFGLLFGALWAKEAWGHYWTWDPKETWAFITWLGYLTYLHYRYKYKNTKSITAFIIVFCAFILLLVCWFGVNYLPTAQNSVHTYSG